MVRRVVLDEDFDRVSSRLLVFVFDLLKQRGADPWKFSADLETIGPGPELPAWVAWPDYIAMIHHLGDVVGGARGVAASMRGALATAAYSEFRAIAGFFPGPVQFYAFVCHHFNRELMPGAWGIVEPIDDKRFHLRCKIDDRLVPSRLYLDGTITLTEVFPTHFGLPEGRVDVESISDRYASAIVTFPVDKPKVSWGSFLEPPARPDVVTTSSLTAREQEVLRLVCEGLTNAEIAGILGTASSTVKSQISSILSKMDVANRTQLAALVSRQV